MHILAKIPCSAASLLCPFRVARVSRLIGNFDSTANGGGWQVTNVAPARAPTEFHPIQREEEGEKEEIKARNATLS